MQCALRAARAARAMYCCILDTKVSGDVMTSTGCPCRRKDSSRTLEVEQPLPQRPSKSTLMRWLHWGASLGVLYLFNIMLAKAVAAAGISFPSPLIGGPPHMRASTFQIGKVKGADNC